MQIQGRKFENFFQFMKAFMNAEIEVDLNKFIDGQRHLQDTDKVVNSADAYQRALMRMHGFLLWLCDNIENRRDAQKTERWCKIAGAMINASLLDREDGNTNNEMRSGGEIVLPALPPKIPKQPQEESKIIAGIDQAEVDKAIG